MEDVALQTTVAATRFRPGHAVQAPRLITRHWMHGPGLPGAAAVAIAGTRRLVGRRFSRRRASIQGVPLLDLAQQPGQPTQATSPGPLLDAFRKIGAFQVRMPPKLAYDTRLIFSQFGDFMALPEAARHQFLCDSKELLAVHGYQPRGGQGERFNRFRSGVVFHGKNTLPLLPEPFEAEVANWRDQVWRLSERILDHLLHELRCTGTLKENLDPGAFHEGASFDMISGSHFQLKQMHSAGQDGESVRLPLHQDPSFMSLLIHASSKPPGQGLEILDDRAQEFVAVPRSGCEFATVLIGQLFHQLCGRGDMRFAKGSHRVVTRPEDMTKQRHTAVFFFQPQLDTLLRPLVPPTTGSHEAPITFRERRLRSYQRFARAAPPWQKD
ncbi:unnamed protein product [Symbiodinium natans]|uniref:Fe2OG dioxygenase domain-containing protein n=1 Tax=Symbiodinium natans TaxID=878477 RepID=A0A812RIP3_9DINO|nr:unnamed protein product [Symbiodinium natans]